MAKCIMIQGTMSNAGKSFLVAGICRILKQDGYRVAPFKSQNMALNSYITEDGLEMGRAQVMQAEACGIEPTVYMNPILLKPTTDVGSQVIVNGVPRGNMRASDYFKYKTQLIPDILHAWQKLSEAYDVIVIEGAGSPAEINLKKNDIVNMGLAELVDAPVLLVGDIDRGGVFAQLAGTLALLDEPERQRIKGFVMNKFRGDVEILRPGLDMLRERCHVETIGVIPYAQLDLDDEDSLSERLAGGEAESKEERIHAVEGSGEEKEIDADERNGRGKEHTRRGRQELLKIAIIRLPRISNFTDFNVLQAMDGVKVSYVSRVSELGEPHMVILPGTKSTIADMRWLRECGLEAAILKLYSRGVTVFGICGGFQMLGERISDPAGTESTETDETKGCWIEEKETSDRQREEKEGTGDRWIAKKDKTAGMRLLPFETVFYGEKVRRRVTGLSGKFTGEYAAASDKKVTGYEIHMGRTVTTDAEQPGGDTPSAAEGTKHVPEDEALLYQKENVFGTYVHGIFDEQEFRESFLGAVAKKNNMDLAAQTVTDYRAYKESQYDKLADTVRGGMDMKKLYEMIGLHPEKYFGGEDTREEALKNSEKYKQKEENNSEIRDDGEYDGKTILRDFSGKRKPGGFLHLYYGDGKGKTTAAIGLAVRAAGAGKKVVFCQFLKSQATAELSVLSCTPGIRILRSEETFGFSWTLSEEDRARLRDIHTELFKEAMRLVETGRCDVLILDEVCDALQKNLMDEKLFYRCLEAAGSGRRRAHDEGEKGGSGGQRKTGWPNTEQSGITGSDRRREDGPENCEWVLTGRTPDERILAAADYVTWMKKEKHPFDEGVKARYGIEY